MISRKASAISKYLWLAALLIFGAGATQAATLTVDDDHAQCPGATFTSIQAAVTAATPGDKINVCPGTYHEQVMINKPLTISGVDIAGQNLATIMPVGVAPNSTSLTTGNPIAAIILVNGTDKVTLTNLTVDGSANGIGGCAPNLIGVYYRNSSGRIDSLAVKNIKLGSGLEGCQSGLGMFVQSGPGGSSKVDILNNSVHDYQKNGITGNEVGTEVNITGNAVTGIGSTPNIAQNGIQIADGAKGTVDSNAVINHIYSQCTDVNTCGAASANILIVDSDDVKVTKNNTGNAQLNIYYQGNKGDVTNNTIFQSRVFDGIDLIGNQNHANNNRIFNSDEAAVYVLGDKNDVNGNMINETPVGILVDAGSTNTHIGGNQYYNTGMDTAPFGAAVTANAVLAGGAGNSRVRAAQP
jgi:hypothetical protein